MNKENIEEKLDEMQDTIYAKAVIAYLQGIIRETDSVRGVKTLSEVLGREIACKKLEKIILRLTSIKKNTNNPSEYE